MDKFALWMLAITFVIMFAFWIIGSIAAMIKRFQEGREQSPLGLARGSIRSFMILVLTGVVIFGLSEGMMSETVVKWLVISYAAVLGLHAVTRKHAGGI